MTILGWIGSILLAICGAPEAYYAIKNKSTQLSWPFLCLWGFGEIFVFLPVVFQIKSPYLILNYSLNLVFISIITYYKIRNLNVSSSIKNIMAFIKK